MHLFNLLGEGSFINNKVHTTIKRKKKNETQVTLGASPSAII
jgi:hypothetical protein